MPKAIACAAPQSPMRTPSRASRPLPASPIIEPIAATANAPFAIPRPNTDVRSGQGGPLNPAAAMAASAIAEAMQPPIVQVRSDPRRPPAHRTAREPN